MARTEWSRSPEANRHPSTSSPSTTTGSAPGPALREVWQHIGELDGSMREAERLMNRSGADERRGLTAALYLAIASHDRRATVVLGDPAVALKLPPRPDR